MRCSANTHMCICVLHACVSAVIPLPHVLKNVWVSVFVLLSECVWLLYCPAACVYEVEQVCGFKSICQCVHMFGSETGWMQHSQRSFQCQAIPGGCEHLVNRLWPPHRPCILTSITVRRLFSTSVVNVKSLTLRNKTIVLLGVGAELWRVCQALDCTSNFPHIKFKEIKKYCLFGEIGKGHVLEYAFD